MLGAVSHWIKQIVMVVIFVAFVDFLVSDSKLYKYIKVLLGLIVMMTILNPLLPLFQQDLTFDKLSLGNGDIDNTFQMSIIDKSEIIRKKNDELTIQQYQNQLEDYIIGDLKSICLYDVIKVTSRINEDISDNDFGKVLEVVITLGKVQSDDQMLSDGRIIVETIKVSQNNNDNDKLLESKLTHENEFKKIRQYLNSKYDVPEEKIIYRLGGLIDYETKSEFYIFSRMD